MCRLPFVLEVLQCVIRRADRGPAEFDLPVPAKEKGGEDGGHGAPSLCHLLLPRAVPHGCGHIQNGRGGELTHGRVTQQTREEYEESLGGI